MMNTFSKQIYRDKIIGEVCPPFVKKDNWINLSSTEKRHISLNLQAFFYIRYKRRHSFVHCKTEYVAALNITAENKKFNVWVPSKEIIIQILDSFAVTIDFNEPKEVLDFARYFPAVLFYADSLLDSKSFALEALSINQQIFPFLNNDLRDNESIVRTAITTWKSKQNFKLMRYASDRLKSSKKFMKPMIQTHPCLFTYLDPKLKKDSELVNVFMSKTDLIRTVSDLNGLLPKVRAEAFKNLITNGHRIRGMSFHWLKRQPKVIREDKLISFYCISHHSRFLYSDDRTSFPKFESLKKHFKENINFKDMIKYYLLILFFHYSLKLKFDDLHYREDALILDYGPRNRVLDNIFERLGSEGFTYSQKIDFTEAFSSKAFDFFEFVEKKKLNKVIKGLQDFYSFLDEHNNFDLFEKALLTKETIPSQEFNCTEIYKYDRYFERNKFWFDGISLKVRAFEENKDAPGFNSFEKHVDYFFDKEI